MLEFLSDIATPLTCSSIVCNSFSCLDGAEAINFGEAKIQFLHTCCILSDSEYISRLATELT